MMVFLSLKKDDRVPSRFLADTPSRIDSRVDSHITKEITILYFLLKNVPRCDGWIR